MARITDVLELFKESKGPMSTSEIRERVDPDSQHIAILLRRLQKQGYVREVTPEGAHCRSLKWWEAVE